MTKTDKQPTIPAVPAPRATTNSSTSVPLIAMVLGVVSLSTFIWFLGIPAIIMGIIALKKYPENRGYSITGLVTGIISTLLMIGFTLFLITIVTIDAINQVDMESDYQYEQRYHQHDTYDDRSHQYEREGA